MEPFVNFRGYVAYERLGLECVICGAQSPSVANCFEKLTHVSFIELSGSISGGYFGSMETGWQIVCIEA